MCLLGSNLNVYANPEELRPSRGYNWNFNPSPES